MSEEAKKLNIGIVQIYDNNIKEYAEYSRLINTLYAHQHNYTYICFEYDLVPTFVSVFYNKLIAVNSVFKDSRNFDWVLYLDSDAAITNFEYKLEDIIARHPNKEFILAKDSNGANNGVFLIKNTSTMADLLEKSYSNSSFYHTRMPEQSAMFHYLSNEFSNYVGIEPPSFFNAYFKGYSDFKEEADVQYWNDKSFILHLFQLATEDRIHIFKQILMKQGIVCMSKPPEASKIKSTLEPETEL